MKCDACSHGMSEAALESDEEIRKRKQIAKLTLESCVSYRVEKEGVSLPRWFKKIGSLICSSYGFPSLVLNESGVYLSSG